MSPEEFKEANEEGKKTESSTRFAMFIAIIFIMLSSVSTALLFCSVELFQLMVLTASEDKSKVPPRF